MAKLNSEWKKAAQAAGSKPLKKMLPKKSLIGWMVWVRNCLIAVVFASVVFCASVVLMGSRTLIYSKEAMAFLIEMQHMPPDPGKLFFSCLAGLLVLGGILMGRSETAVSSQSAKITGALAEAAAAIWICAVLHFSYNGTLLLVLCDLIFHFGSSNRTNKIIFGMIVVYFFCNYQLISRFVPMSDLSLYFQVFSANVSGTLLLIKSILDMFSFILALGYLGIFLSWQLDENRSIMEELSMLNQVNQELRNYAAVTEKIGEDKERKRIAREIHDTLGHALTGIAAGVDATVAIIDKNPQAARSQLMLVSKVVRQGIGDVRNSLKKLRPGALEEQGFKGALQKMLEEISSVSDLKVSLQYEADGLDLEVVREDALFRMIQESITNALRHGGADWVGIHIYEDSGKICVTIRDNGIGCEKIEFGYGLRQMQERAAILRGTVSFDGSHGFETRIVLPAN